MAEGVHAPDGSAMHSRWTLESCSKPPAVSRDPVPHIRWFLADDVHAQDGSRNARMLDLDMVPAAQGSDAVAQLRTQQGVLEAVPADAGGAVGPDSA